jgi:asparagine synthase (glutamine-hydrolysing)
MRPAFLAVAGPPFEVDSFLRGRRWPDRLPTGWTLALRLPGLAVVARPAAGALLFSDGAVFGRLFSRADAGPIQDASTSLGQEISASRGRFLVDRCWGAWFAIFTDRTGGHWALRDPSALAPAYWRDAGVASCYFSDLRTATDLGLAPSEVDSEFLPHWLVYPHLRTERTGLRDVRELLPGTRRTVSASGASTATLWSPWHFAGAAGQIDDFEDSAERLRRTILQAVPAQARGQGSLILELSGGLDSSIIAAALRSGGVSFRSLNFATRTAEGDERRYARAVAAALSAGHFEIDEADTPLELGLPDRQRLRPGVNAVVVPLHRQFAMSGEALGADTFLTGAGGDNVFCHLTTAAPVLDSWRRLGAAHALRQTVGDVSDICSCTSWTTARFALRKAIRSIRGPSAWRREQEFIHADAAPSRPEPHPWLDPPGGSLPGKVEHVAALLRIQHFVDPETRLSELPFLHPLLAQPIVELCLRIPTWSWVSGGLNRAVARRAFRGLVPQEVLDRRSKGRLEGMCLRSYVRHRKDVAELLLGGLLRQTGLIDPDPLESYLEREEPPGDALYYRILELVSCELWLRSWSR